MDGFLANNIPVLVQQFIEPTHKHKYIDLRFIIVNGQVAACMKRSSGKRDEIRTNISLGGSGQPYKPSESEIEIAANAAQALGLTVAGVDIIPSGRKRLVIEVNTSPGFVVEEVTGINIAKKIVGQAVTGARKGHRPTSQKLIDILNTDVSLAPIRPIPPTKLRPLRKISLITASARRATSKPRTKRAHD
jgi:hypothetical protein